MSCLCLQVIRMNIWAVSSSTRPVTTYQTAQFHIPAVLPYLHSTGMSKVKSLKQRQKEKVINTKERKRRKEDKNAHKATERSSPWEANSSSANQENPSILRKPKFQCRQTRLWLHQPHARYLFMTYIYYTCTTCFGKPHTIVRENPSGLLKTTCCHAVISYGWCN